MANGKWQMANGKANNTIQTRETRKEPIMAKYQHFEELPVWQEAARLYNLVLDLLEEPGVPLTPSFRNQLDRAALSISNNVAEGFERSTTNELQSFIAIARGSAGEVRSMMAVVKDRPKLKPYIAALQRIRAIAESCARQLTGWAGAVDKFSFAGRRHLAEKQRTFRQTEQKSRDFRLNFLKSLKPSHPLYKSSEARAARGESPD
jgi:four helix bundle protein